MAGPAVGGGGWVRWEPSGGPEVDARFELVGGRLRPAEVRIVGDPVVTTQALQRVRLGQLTALANAQPIRDAIVSHLDVAPGSAQVPAPVGEAMATGLPARVEAQRVSLRIPRPKSRRFPDAFY